jgi:glycopeptide antibiotics resistance protein
VQVGGNLAVLAAFGSCAPVRWDLGSTAARVLTRVALLSSGASLTLEAVQWLAGIGRVSAADDVLLNAGGAVLAAACSRRWWGWGASDPSVVTGRASTRAPR